MAVTKVWAIKDSLQRVLDYAANPEKTEYDALAQTLHYAENDAKTKLNESAQLVTGIHCRADHAWRICGLYRSALVKQTAWWRSTLPEFPRGGGHPGAVPRNRRGAGTQGLGQALSGAGRHTHEYG